MRSVSLLCTVLMKGAAVLIWSVSRQRALNQLVLSPARGMHVASDAMCCSTVWVVELRRLTAWVLEGLVEGEVINQVIVDDEIVYWARVALERMLA